MSQVYVGAVNVLARASTPSIELYRDLISERDAPPERCV